MSYRIVPIPDTVAQEVRQTRSSPGYKHPVHGAVATGYGPCRSCLKPFEKGVERRLLFTYDAFAGREELPLPGPVFVHEEACTPYAESDRFPEELRFIPMTLNAYGRGRQLREVAYVEPHGDVEAAIAGLLARDDVDYIHVRNTEAGCYMFTIERSGEAAVSVTE
jgi:hypothetical protein